ncbi:MAG TPA: transcriptional repressor LexA [Candidatus Brocadiia bacterium]|nr:transcriptional repressor LexA [Candidatus Brocadiia bacterium]
MKNKELTDRQREILDFISDCIRSQGVPPTVREIAGHFGMRSPRAVSDHLCAIERKGYLRRGKGKSRQLHPVGSISDRDGVPIIGRVAAGSPILAEENLEGKLDCAEMGGGDRFALRIRGESMIEAGMLDGDHVIVDPRADVKNGDIAVVRVGDEATVKKVFFLKNGLKLQPANRTMSPRIVGSEDEVEICGKVVGLVRKF